MNQQHTLADGPTNIMIVANPAAGRGTRANFLDDLANGLRRVGLHTSTLYSLDEFRTQYTTQVAANEIRSVIAVGGDGTAAAVANITQGQIPILIAPMGTENLLATRLGLTCEVPSLVRAIRQGSVHRLDVGRVNGQIFLIMFSCGFDAEVVRRLHESRKGPISRWSYAQPILSSLTSYRYPPIAIECSLTDGDQASISLDGHWAFAFNLNCYARGLQIAPDASPMDGKFDVCVLWSPSLLSGLFHFLTVAARCQGKWSGFQRLRCARLRIESRERVPFQIDGESGGYLPAELEVLPGWIPLVVPTGGP